MRLVGTPPTLLFGKIRPRPGSVRANYGFLRAFDRPLPQAQHGLYKRITNPPPKHGASFTPKNRWPKLAVGDSHRQRLPPRCRRPSLPIAPPGLPRPSLAAASRPPARHVSPPSREPPFRSIGRHKRSPPICSIRSDRRAPQSQTSNRTPLQPRSNKYEPLVYERRTLGAFFSHHGKIPIGGKDGDHAA